MQNVLDQFCLPDPVSGDGRQNCCMKLFERKKNPHSSHLTPTDITMKNQGQIQKITENYSGTVRLLAIEKEILRFQFLVNHSLQKEITLEAGYQTIANRFFQQDIPTEAETEYAINYIEDELMSSKDLLNRNETLVSSDQHLAEVFHKNGFTQSTFSRREVENLFTQYAYVVMGRLSSVKRSAITREDFATLLLLREITHHLDFEAIDLVD